MPIERIRGRAWAGVVLLALPVIAGCSTLSPPGSASDAAMGEAMRQTMAAQIIDPDPVYDYADPVTSGAHAAAAVERYRKDAVKKPERIRTSNAVGGGGGGGAGSSGG
ncbi:hypothetical protein OLX02_02055 [Novosphingobium sp. KCTC 2891]|uniref:hypothetical protein n=1 Tax=Novosphingobium sp. KCTC 2891 TaxID=2989730 RepID=UPI0022214CAE|nr:hypothetical protein [Novosphingobium sp. KCTC 2891]MCW1381597.1 hypothetical protein [Novosphingobium sp. KCTC 2891]